MSGRGRIRWAGIVAANIAATIGLVCWVEGCASIFLALRKASSQRPPLERSHTRFDAELGWVNRPGLRLADLYGPGETLTINAQGFRSTKPTPSQSPPGRLRVVCAGDSFTLGFGVSDDETFCALLAAKDPRFDTVNLGQAGYGVDQAWLWYRRDGVPLAHDALVFSFIKDDFRRLGVDRFWGYSKPLLTVRDGRPEPVNTPLSPRSLQLPGMARTQIGLSSLAISRLILQSGSRGAGYVNQGMSEERSQEVVRAIFRDLAAERAARGIALLFVFLPTQGLLVDGETAAWQRFVAEQLRELGLPYLDLVAQIEREPIAALRSFYRRGHFSEAGNRWAAERIHAALVADPLVTARLDALPPTPGDVSANPAP